MYSAIALLSWPALRGLYRLRARGLENLPAEGGFGPGGEAHGRPL